MDGVRRCYGNVAFFLVYSGHTGRLLYTLYHAFIVNRPSSAQLVVGGRAGAVGRGEEQFAGRARAQLIHFHSSYVFLWFVRHFSFR